MKMKYIALVVSATLMGCHTDSDSDQAPVEPQIQVPSAKNVLIKGSPAIGSLLTGEYDYSDTTGRPEGASTFAWYSAVTRSALSTTETLTLTAAQAGQQVTFCVKPIAEGHSHQEGKETCSDPLQVEKIYEKPVATNVAISGNRFVGATLTGIFEAKDADNQERPLGEHEYAWTFADGTPSDVIGTEKTLPVTQAMEGEKIQFCITPVVEPGHDNDTNFTGDPACASTTEVILPAAGTAPTATALTINDKAAADIATYAPEIGDVLTADWTFNDVDGDAQVGTTVRWTGHDGAEHDLATGPTLTITDAHVGMAIQFHVTPRSDKPEGWEDYPTIGGEADSAKTLAVLSEPVLTVSITGDVETPQVGDTLTGAYSYQRPARTSTPTHATQWQRGGALIAGTEDQAAYQLTLADVAQTVAFCVDPTPQAKTDALICEEVTGITDPDAPVPVPTVTLNPIVKPALPTVGDTLTASYTYATSNTDADDSAAKWKIGTDGTLDVACNTGEACDLTLQEAHLGQAISYCVTAKSTNSAAADDAQCTVPTDATMFALRWAGKLELYQTLDLDIYGYANPQVTWTLVQRDGTETELLQDSDGDHASSYTIAQDIVAAIPDSNANGFVDDKDWANAVTAGTVTDATPRATQYVASDIEVCVTSTEKPAGECINLSTENAVTGGLSYFTTGDTIQRGIEPVREVNFGALTYHRPVTVAEAQDGSLGAIPQPTEERFASDIQWAAYNMISTTTPAPEKATVPAIPEALGACLDLGDGNTWYLPSGRQDSGYHANAKVLKDLGNNAPDTTVADKANFLMQLTKLAASGLIGHATEHLSPVMGWPTGAETTIDGSKQGATPYWSASTVKLKLPDDSLDLDQTLPAKNLNAIQFYKDGSSANSTFNHARFVSCVKLNN